MRDVQVTDALVGALLIVSGWLAGRNRKLARTMRTMVDVYEQLVADLRTEIDRLRAEVVELRTLLTARSRKRTSAA